MLVFKYLPSSLVSCCKGSIRICPPNSGLHTQRHARSAYVVASKTTSSACLASKLLSLIVSRDQAILSHHLIMRLFSSLLVLAGAASIAMAQVQQSPGIAFVNNPIPGSRSATNVTGSSNTTHLEYKQAATAAGGWCGLHMIQSNSRDDFFFYWLRLVDWNGKVIYQKFCDGSVCNWPLLGMGDYLVSTPVTNAQGQWTTTIQFYRQGTISNDQWLNTDPLPRCKLGGWGGANNQYRQFDCGFSCKPYQY